MDLEGLRHTIPMISSTPVPNIVEGLYPTNYDEMMSSVCSCLR